MGSINSNDNNNKPLPERVLNILQGGMQEGYLNNELMLNACEIEDSMIQELYEWLTKIGNKVKKLNLQKNRITSTGAIMLFDSLRESNLEISELNLSNNELDDECIKSLGLLIQNSKYIEDLKIGYNSISDRGVKIMAVQLIGNVTLRSLALYGNRGITDQSILSLIMMIESSHISSLRLAYTSITKMNSFVLPLTKNTLEFGFNELILAFMNIDGEIIQKVCGMMQEYGTHNLKVVNFDGNRFTSDGVTLLLNKLRDCNSTVSVLGLAGNDIGDDCMTKIGEYVQDNQNLQGLLLDSNKFTDEGVRILAEHLAGNAVLKELWLTSNRNITNASIPYFKDMAKRSYITRVGVSNTSISRDHIQEIQDEFNIPFDQREVPVKSNAKSATKSST